MPSDRYPRRNRAGEFIYLEISYNDEMDKEQLTSYVATERGRGVNDADIKTQLLATGWKEEDVNAALGIVSMVTAPEAPKKFALNKLNVGRVNRMQYFLTWVLLLVIGITAMFAMIFIGQLAITEDKGGFGILLFVIPAIFVYLATLLLGLFLGVRRLHDMNMNGWYMLVVFIPAIGWIFGLFILFKPGSAGVNKYGNPPDTNHSIWKVLINI